MADSNTVSLSKLTYGEKLVASLISKLPKDLYFAVAQPTLIDREGQSWKPDFVLVSARLGVIILEIKDWISIKDIGSRSIPDVLRKGNKFEE
ncbi:MAG TPA: NERD domain-containing protein [Phototrophicaceae bacterium]|jgi:hypothetical protein|nr:NERD domain-containing protein [Phototrophicaceae bacterium]